MKSVILAILACIAIFRYVECQAAMRAASVKGKLVCGKVPVEAWIRIYRTKENQGPKQIIDNREASDSGFFEVGGNTNGFALNETSMAPYVKIYHKCDVPEKKKEEYRTFGFTVPSNFVTNGRIAKKTYDFGTVNLELAFPKETKDKKFVKNPEAVVPA
uniref:Transthyretin-like family protein n=1 Tax=Rhabditophanes sp. KR3021 TaxID=114890 RepID=A0AC35UHN8_9BILA